MMASEQQKILVHELNIEHKKDILGSTDKSVRNINMDRNMMKAWDENCSNERKHNKLYKTDNESVNILVLKCFQKCHTMDITCTRNMAVLYSRHKNRNF
jgi:hypothetical protein